MVYKDDNELDIAKEFGDPVNDYNNEINATCVTLSSLSLSYDTKSDTNTYSAEDYQESPKPLRAMRRKRKVKIYSRASSETSTHRKVSDINAFKNVWWSPILERNVKGCSRKIRVD
nr:uncharacterized protein LOC113398098 [Vanessa tameamea]